MISRYFALALACALTVTAVPAVAQDASLTANFGERRLSAGFQPDPYSVDVVAGGSIDASQLGGSCVGKISTAPDFQLTYTAGGLPLAFRTRSGEDTTLVINGPDGGWHCDDDSWGDGDAQVIFRDAQSGVYDVWIGTYGDNPASGALIITEEP
ncbi:MAG: peptidase S1 [Brevundimonas sp.]